MAKNAKYVKSCTNNHIILFTFTIFIPPSLKVHHHVHKNENIQSMQVSNSMYTEMGSLQNTITARSSGISLIASLNLMNFMNF